MSDRADSPVASTLGILSILAAVFGWVLYCLGAFFCLSPLGIALWVVGAVLGLIGLLVGGQGGARAAGCAGLALNVLSIVAIVALAVVGVGLYGILVALAVIAESG